MIASLGMYDRAETAPALDRFWAAIRDLDDAGTAIDTVTVVDHLKTRGTLASVGGLPYIAELITEGSNQRSRHFVFAVANGLFSSLVFTTRGFQVHGTDNEAEDHVVDTSVNQTQTHQQQHVVGTG